MTRATVGDRVELVSTSDTFTRLQPGVQGTVSFIDDVGTVHVDWDNGAHLGLIPGEDRWRVLDAAR